MRLRPRPGNPIGEGDGGFTPLGQGTDIGGGQWCIGKIIGGYTPSFGREAATSAAGGSGGALKLPQRVRAEPGRQMFFGVI